MIQVKDLYTAPILERKLMFTKKKNDLADITIIMDRSSSMSQCKEEAESGVNNFIKEQKEQKGEALFSFIQFDTQYEVLYKGIDLQDAGEFTLMPRGMTALLDAVGRGITETAERISKLTERPNLVIFVILTDGHENASSEFSREKIKTLIEKHQKEDNWQFTFLGANQDAFAEAGSMGINKDATMNYNIHNSHHVFSMASDNVSQMRSMSIAGANVVNEYTDKQREEAVGEKV
jgi:hypothetical protein